MTACTADDIKVASGSGAVACEGHSMALLLATKKGDIVLVKKMLEVLAVEEVNIATANKKETALHIAALYGHTEIAEMLLACPRASLRLMPLMVTITRPCIVLLSKGEIQL